LKDFEKLRKELDEFKNIQTPEIDVKRLEKWMKKKLNVERQPDKSGVSLIYQQPILKKYREADIFTVHRVHPASKSKPKITRIDFKRYLYPTLEKLIDCLEMEAQSEKE
jgi:hypothetical protein